MFCLRQWTPTYRHLMQVCSLLQKRKNEFLTKLTDERCIQKNNRNFCFSHIIILHTIILAQKQKSHLSKFIIVLYEIIIKSNRYEIVSF